MHTDLKSVLQRFVPAKSLQLCPTLRPHGLSPARLLCPWDSPGENTGVGCHFLLQGIFPTQRRNQRLLRLLRWQAASLPLRHCRKPSIQCHRVYELWQRPDLVRFETTATSKDGDFQPNKTHPFKTIKILVSKTSQPRKNV